MSGRAHSVSVSLGRAALLAAALVVLPGGAQVAPGNPPSKLSTQIGHALDEMEPVSSIELVEEERRVKRLNQERQRQMVADTNKLLKLTAEYYAEIAKTNPDRLTRNQLRQLSEMEKLAKNVKERMVMGVGGGPVFRDPGLYLPIVR